MYTASSKLSSKNNPPAMAVATINPIEPHKRNLQNSSCFPLLYKWLSAKATKLEWTGEFTIELNVTITSRC